MINPKKPEALMLSLCDSIKILREAQTQLRFCDEGYGYLGATYCEMFAGIISLAIDNVIEALQDRGKEEKTCCTQKTEKI